MIVTFQTEIFFFILERVFANQLPAEMLISYVSKTDLVLVFDLWSEATKV